MSYEKPFLSMRPTSFEQDVNPFYSVCRAKARPSKKARVTNPPEDPVAEEEEPRVEPEQTGEPEGLHPETTFDDPPFTGQHTDEPTDVEPAAPDAEPAEPNRANPMKDTEIPSSSTKNPEGQGDDVIITRTGHNSPGHPVILAQHSAKEEQIARDKGKWSSDLSNYAHLNADELHSGFLNRLHSNRDYEAGLVNLMKERYEVNSSPLHIDL